MKLKLQLSEKTIGREFRQFLKLTGEDNWVSKIRRFNARPKLSKLDIVGEYLAAKNPLLGAVIQYLELEKRGQVVWRHRTPEILRGAGYVFILNRLSREPNIKFNRIKGLLLDNDKIKPFLFEIDIAAHFLRQGYNVIFADLEGVGQYDLLIQGDRELEVECKRISADAGRKITRYNFFYLSDILFTQLQQVKGRFLISLTAADRLGTDERIIRKLADRIRKSLTTNSLNDSVQDVRFTVEPLPGNVAIRTNEEAAAELSQYSTGSEHFTVFDNNESTFIVRCGSMRKDDILTAIYDTLKDASWQLSGTRAGLIPCFIEDVDGHDWSSLQKGSGLTAVTTRLFNSPDRGHVQFVTFSSDHQQIRETYNAVSYSTTNLTFENTKARYPVPREFIKMKI
jgi:hypothetical protein